MRTITSRIEFCACVLLIAMLACPFRTMADDAASLNEHLSRAEAARQRGQIHDAMNQLDAVDAARMDSGKERAAYLRERALVRRAAGDVAAAQEDARNALSAAEAAGDTRQMASVHNDLGVMAMDQGATADALAHFQQAQALAPEFPAVSVRVDINRARLALQFGHAAEWQSAVARAQSHLASLPDDAETAWSWLALGGVIRDGQKQLEQPAALRLQAFAAFQQAQGIAELIGSSRLLSWTQGSIGALYEDELRFEEALGHTRRAAFLAQSIDADEPLYRWQWQAGRVLRAMGDSDLASVSYRQAIATLERLRPDVASAPGAGFRERAAPVFFDFADMLLSRTRTLDDPAAVQSSLVEVRATLERVKVAEVRDYFDDQCVATGTDAMELERIGESAAILYPILLPDRTELLVSLPGGLRQFTSPVSAQVLTEEVRQLRRMIETYDGRVEYLVHAQRLYQWLIAPLAATLDASGVDTLVIVPDGPLRTIPLAALHDGTSFLVERYALATTPGLTLTSPRPLERENVELLAGGLTQSVQGFSALPNVASELQSVSAEFPSRTLQDEAFMVASVQRQIAEGDQQIVHIATHGQFDSDHTQSFLLAWDDKFTMDRLQSTIAARGRTEEPLELLVLSACQTAAGDDRAALGLAGVALKAGARSALATLWFVNDESTARMVSDFYRYLGDPEQSKAQALRQAQLALIHDRRFSHPSYWAPFLLIGNWL